MSMRGPIEAPPTARPSSTSTGRSRHPPLPDDLGPVGREARVTGQFPDRGEALQPFEEAVVVSPVVLRDVVEWNDIAQGKAVAVRVEKAADVQLRVLPLMDGFRTRSSYAAPSPACRPKRFSISAAGA